MSQIGTELPTEYSDRFDKLRQNRAEVSFYKYGTAKDNFGEKLVNALESHDMCIKKYRETGLQNKATTISSRNSPMGSPASTFIWKRASKSI